MKRYGYKFTKDDGGLYRLSGLRFFIGLCAFFSTITSLIFSGESQLKLYLASLFAFWLAAFLAEVAPKVRSYPVIFSAITAGIIFWIDPRNVFIVRQCENWQCVDVENFNGKIIYLGFCGMVVIAALWSLRRQSH
ncbi:hypothetical protein MJO52_00715 [Microbulbifer variabilis]|uniref:Integron gene cassette protein n=1 Tax=Microbulbifer variabilis TaxID=266805 RepID=A0ABY4VE76_9GAMM|nr:hypothetical protein [Microbulbifer variabilis]USD21696.1 hypothetical protein MJO52_00715 [Microbulbifer variabilis]